jgi:hypothetical protein
MTNKIYIGNTQQNFSKRMVGHFQDIKKLREKGVQIGLLCQTFGQHLAKRSCSTVARDAVEPHRMQDYMARHPNIGGQNLWQVHLVLCATEKGWKPLNFSEQSLINLSTLAPKSMEEHANTIQSSIGITSRRNPPVLMSAKSMKKSSWRSQTHLEEESIQVTQMGMNL